MKSQKQPKKWIGRAFLSGLDDLAYLAVVVVIVVFANALLKDVGHLRWDLTAEKLYTLTDASKAFVRDLPGPVQVKAFFSEGLQAPDHNLAQRVEDLLSEYAASSGGKFSYEIVFPKDEDDEEQARGFGVEKVAVGQRDRDQVGLRLVYKGIALSYGDKLEVISEVRGTDNLEYALTKAMMNLVHERPRTIGVVQGFGGPADMPPFMDSLREAFQEIYGKLIQARGINLAEVTEIPDDVDALVVLNVQETMSEAAKVALDQFLMRGKSVGVFQSPTKQEQQLAQMQLRVTTDHGLRPLLEHYGVLLHSDLLLDRQKNLVGLEVSARGMAQVSIPSLPILPGLNKENIMTKDFDAVVFPFSGTVGVSDALLRSDAVMVTLLIESADTAVTRPAVGDTRWETLMRPSEDEQPGPHMVAVAVDGRFTSAYAETWPEDVVKPQSYRAASEDGARLLVVANGEFMLVNPRIGYGPEFARFGVHFFLNTMDWLVQDEALIRIRGKGMPRILEPVDKETQRWLQFANIAGVPLGIVLLGIAWFGVRWWRRKRIALYFQGAERG